MPKIVDHDQRRGEIVEAYLTVVARDGLPAATSRALAAELGVGIGALWHYFDGFDAVTSAAFQRVFERTNIRIAAATTGLRGLDALYAMMREILPLTKETLDEAAVVVGFWGRLAANEKLISGQAVAMDLWADQMRAALNEAITDGRLRDDTPVEDIVALLQSISAGQQVHAVIRSPLVDPARQIGLVDGILRPFLQTTKTQKG